jgi:hypothetical protein
MEDLYEQLTALAAKVRDMQAACEYHKEWADQHFTTIVAIVETLGITDKVVVIEHHIVLSAIKDHIETLKRKDTP